MFDRPNTFFYFDYNGHFKPFQFKLGQRWNNTSEAKRNGWSDHDFNNFDFIYLDTALYDATNHVFGFTTVTDTVVTDTVIISCDLSKWTCTMEQYRIIDVMKYHYYRRKTNFLRNLQYSALHVLIPSELKEVRDILKDPGFEIPYNTLYQFYNLSSYTFTFSKEDFLSDDNDHLNFKLKIDAKNPSKEKKLIFEFSNSIYDSPDEIAAPKDIKTILGGKGEKF